MTYPTGVPSPYTAHIHPYPTRFHGGIWRRPVFGTPYVRSPFNVIRPSQMMVPPAASGMGVWDTGTGVFRHPNADGGGIFNEISGLGEMSATTKAYLGGGLLAFGLVLFLASRGKKMTPNQRRAKGVPGWDVFLGGKKIDHIVHVQPTLHAALGLPEADATEVKATLVEQGYDPAITVRRGKSHKQNGRARRRRRRP